MPGTPTTKHSIPTMEGASDLGSTIDDTFNSAMAALDALIATAITTDPRPTASKFGRFHRATDGTISFDTGSAWVEVARHPHAAKHAAGGSDPLTVTDTMVASDFPLPPIGTALPYAGSTEPAGGKWLFADGRLLAAGTYAALNTLIGSGGSHAFNGGVDPGSGNFRIPDLRGRVPVGADNMGTAQGAANRLPNSNRARGQNGGAERHALLLAELAAHAHTGGAHTHGDTFAVASANVWTAGWTAPLSNAGWSEFGASPSSAIPNAMAGGPNNLADDASMSQTGSGGAHAHTLNGAVSSGGAVATTSVGSGTAHNNLQPYEVHNWIVRVL